MLGEKKMTANRVYHHRTPLRFAAMVALAAAAACDFSVTNPGPVQDRFLDDPAAHEALASGAAKLIAHSLGQFAYTGGVVSREITASGLVGRFGIEVRARAGILHEEDKPEHWDDAQQARWTAEDGVRRLNAVVPEGELEAYTPAARLYLMAGYANRLLGENVCEGVIDGSPAQSHMVYFERAEQHFSNAIRIADNAGEQELHTAAFAGRASVRGALGDWTGAVQDAQEVPDDFDFTARYSSDEELQYNRHYWTVANSPYRAQSVWNTYYEDYYRNTGDPRTPWGEDPDFPFGGSAPEGDVPWLFQLKFASRDSPINLSSGIEARLIEAEAALNIGEWEQAMALINGVRVGVVSDLTGEPLEAWAATSIEEAWAALKRERGIALWLEGRRLGDMRRWLADGVPGDVDPMQDMTDRSLCFPISITERQTNPNL